MMKKIILILLVCFSYVAGSSQAIIQRGTSAVTVQDDRWKARLNAFLPAYTDTTAANLQKGIDSCGAIIFTYNYGLWYRACSPKRWVQVIPGSNPSSDTLYWKIGGNNNLTALDNFSLGSLDSSEINIITDGVIRIVFPANGITRNGSTDLKNLKYDTSTKKLYYYDDGGSGGSGITSLSQGFGMNNSANPITTTGTVAVDSGVIATRNYVDSFYNNVNQLNDSTFTIVRENGTQDTIQILTGIANVIDSLRRLPGSTIVQALKNGVWISQYIDSVGGGGGGSGTVTNVSRTNGYGISASVANPTTTPDITIAIDSATVFPQIRATIPSSTTDTTSLSNRINLKVNIADTGSMLNPYLRKSDTTSLSSRINSKLNISDTTVFVRKGTWTDYSGTSTITGWSSYTTKLLQYEITDKVMRVMVQIEGTGSGATTSFTLPLNASAWGTQYFILQTQNNTTQSASVATVSASGSTVTVSNSASTTSSWTNAVQRNVRGQFFINIQ